MHSCCCWYCITSFWLSQVMLNDLNSTVAKWQLVIWDLSSILYKRCWNECDWWWEVSKGLPVYTCISVWMCEMGLRFYNTKTLWILSTECVCPRGHVCVTYLRVGGNQSLVNSCRRWRAGAFDGSASPTLRTLRSYTDGVINGRRAREGNLSLISTFAPDCHLC